MTRNLKTLGLALVAVLAMSAVAASTASAQLGKITSDGSVTLKGVETPGGGTNALTGPFGNPIHCHGSTYTGHKIATTPHTLIPSGATEITVTPHYTNCTTPNVAVTVDMNGCDYRFYDATTTGGVAGTYGVLVDLVCPPGKDPIITDPDCFNSTITIEPAPANQGLTGLHLTNGAGNVRVHGTIEGIKAICSGFTVNSKLHIDVTMSGVNSLGGATSVSASH